MNDDRITYRQLSQLIDGRDRPAAHAIENAARGVNAAEQAIRQPPRGARVDPAARAPGGAPEPRHPRARKTYGKGERQS